jgi:hypothetical protein
MPTVPVAEQQRAQAALASVRSELHFGPNQEPLPYVRAVTSRLGYPWGLNGKRGDANNPSGDILAYDFPGQQPELYDVLGDGGGANSPQFNALPYPQPAGAVFIRVESTPEQPPVTPPVQPPTVDLSVVLAKLDALTAQHAAIQQQLDAIASKLTQPPPAMPPVVFPKYTGSARLGMNMTFTLEPQK